VLSASHNGKSLMHYSSVSNVPTPLGPRKNRLNVSGGLIKRGMRGVMNEKMHYFCKNSSL
jgi:hypothetical protein